jgi:5-methylcytosine-specific restriction enzyme B
MKLLRYGPLGKPGTKAHTRFMRPADQVRDYAVRVYVEPARQNGSAAVRIRCGDIHSALKFKNRHPLVCAAIGAIEFRRANALELQGVEGPAQSSTTTYTFRLLR